MSVISFLDTHAGAITAIATVVLAGVTYLYLMETRKQNSTAVRPIPQLRLSPENVKDETGDVKMFLLLCVKNIGHGPLVDIEGSVIEPAEEHFEKKVVLNVGENTRIQLSEKERYQERNKIKIVIKYHDIFDKEYKFTYDNLETHINDTDRLYGKLK